MLTDIEISRSANLKPITEIGTNYGIAVDDLIPYGRTKAKVPLSYLDEDKIKASNLILVTAITPNKAGVGKTVTSVGLSLGLNYIGKKALVALREPSLGPCFGMKGGAAGGGYAQVLPMEDINLHFTGDFHAITCANNMISALLDNYQFNNKHTDRALATVLWRRVLDVNDRNLRNVITGLVGASNGVTTETGFDITAASEIMAVLCLASDLEDLERRIDNIVLGYKSNKSVFTVKDLGISPAIAVLLKDALLPNLVQTTENTGAIIHGGPFANIAHGCNSVIATKMALSLGDYVVTESGFGSDLGAEKFLDIKCRTAGFAPKCTVIVASLQAIKLHGGATEATMKVPDATALRNGLKNVERHIDNVQAFGQSVVISINKYGFDTQEEIAILQDWCKEKGVRSAVNECFIAGGKGAAELAQAVVDTVENNPSGPIDHPYDLVDSIPVKIEKLVKRVYGGDGVRFDSKAADKFARFKANEWDKLPVCVAKTQYSFSDDVTKGSTPNGFTITIHDLVINAGAGFVVAVAGDIMRMPGLPKDPQANHIRLVNGLIDGLN
jgi:formate--tetrahydrofolate ligase